MSEDVYSGLPDQDAPRGGRTATTAWSAGSWWVALLLVLLVGPTARVQAQSSGSCACQAPPDSTTQVRVGGGICSISDVRLGLRIVTEVVQCGKSVTVVNGDSMGRTASVAEMIDFASRVPQPVVHQCVEEQVQTTVGEYYYSRALVDRTFACESPSAFIIDPFDGGSKATHTCGTRRSCGDPVDLDLWLRPLVMPVMTATSDAPPPPDPGGGGGGGGGGGSAEPIYIIAGAKADFDHQVELGISVTGDDEYEVLIIGSLPAHSIPPVITGDFSGVRTGTSNLMIRSGDKAGRFQVAVRPHGNSRVVPQARTVAIVPPVLKMVLPGDNGECGIPGQPFQSASLTASWAVRPADRVAGHQIDFSFRSVVPRELTARAVPASVVTSDDRDTDFQIGEGKIQTCLVRAEDLTCYDELDRHPFLQRNLEMPWPTAAIKKSPAPDRFDADATDGYQQVYIAPIEAFAPGPRTIQFDGRSSLAHDHGGGQPAEDLTYRWSLESGPGSSLPVTGADQSRCEATLFPGRYTMRLTVTEPGTMTCIDTAEIKFRIAAPPIISQFTVTPDKMCVPGEVALGAQAFDVDELLEPLVYTWTVKTESGTEVGSLAGESGTLSGLPAGRHTVSLTVKDSDRLETTKSTYVTVFEPVARIGRQPTSGLDPDVLVLDPGADLLQVSLSSSGSRGYPGDDGTAPLLASWTLTSSTTAVPAIGDPTQRDLTLALGPGTYTAGLRVSSDGVERCLSPEVTDTFRIASPPRFVRVVPPATDVIFTCKDGLLPLEATAVDIESPPAALTYTWSVVPADAAQVSGQGAFVTVTPARAGYFLVTAVVRDEDGLSDTVAFPVKALDPAPIIAKDPHDDQGQYILQDADQMSILLDGRQSLGMEDDPDDTQLEYSWTLTRATTSSPEVVVEAQTGAIRQNLGPGRYTGYLEVWPAGLRDCARRKSESFRVLAPPRVLRMVVEPQPACPGRPVLVSTVVQDLDTPAESLTYTWSGRGPDGSALPLITFGGLAALPAPVAGRHVITVTVADPDGLERGSTVDFDVAATCGLKDEPLAGCPDTTNAARDASVSGLPFTKVGLSGLEEGYMPPRFSMPTETRVHTGGVCQAPVDGGGSDGGGSGGDPGGGGGGDSAGERCGVSGDPVDPINGKVVVEEVDLSWSSLCGPVAFRRTYVSRRGGTGLLGPGWTHIFDRRLVQGSGGAWTEVDGRGVSVRFTAGAGGVFTSSVAGVTLTTSPEGVQTVRYVPTGRMYRYGSDGRFLAIEDASGNAVTLSYGVDGQLSAITDPSGKTLGCEVAGGRLRRLLAPGGLTVQLAYDSEGRLVAVSDTQGHVTHYQYHPDHGDLTTIAYPEGERVEYVYDSQRRATHVHMTAVDATVSTQRFEYPSAIERRMIDAANRVIEVVLDEAGRAVRRKDPDGGVTEYIRDPAGRLLEARTPGNLVHRWQYGASGHLTAYMAPDGVVTRAHRVPSTGFPTALEHPDGAMNHRQFNSAGQVVTRTDPLNRTTLLLRDSTGRVSSQVDPAGRETVMARDASGDVTSTTDAAGQTTSFVRDPLGRVVKSTSPGGRESRSEFDGLELVVTVDAAGSRTRYERDAASRVVAVHAPDGTTTFTTYVRKSGRDLVVTSTDAAGAVTRNEHDSTGRPTAVIDPLSRRTAFDLDAQGRVIRTVLPDGTESFATYDDVGRVSSNKDARGAVTRFEYDAHSRQVAVVHPDGTRSEAERDARGRVVLRRDATGATQRTVYDAASQVVATIDPMGAVSTSTYSATGVVVAATDPRGATTQFGYDSVDQLVSTTNALGHTTRTEFDADGQPIATHHARGQTTRSQYDALGQVVAQIDPLGGVVRREFDVMGRVTRVEDERGNAWLSLYDVVGRRTALQDPSGRVTRFTWNAAGELMVQTHPDGSRWVYTRDLMGRVKERRLETPTGQIEDTERFEHDAVGNTVVAENRWLRISRTIDLMGRETERRTLYRATGRERRQTFLHDAVGRRTATHDDRGRTSLMEYDLAGRPIRTTIIEPDSGARSLPAHMRARVYTFNWDAASNLVQVDRPNGLRTRRTLDLLGRVTSLVHERVTGYGAPVVLQSFAFRHDAGGNVTEIVNERGEASRFEYDLRDQLTRALLPRSQVERIRAQDDAKSRERRGEDDDEAEERLLCAEEISYKLDPSGNRIEENRGGQVIRSTFGPVNELLTRGDVSFKYNDRGSLTEKRLGNGKREVFGYAVAGQLATYGRIDDGRNAKLKHIERYAYGPDSQRISVEDLTKKITTYFNWEGGRPVEEWTVDRHGRAVRERGVSYMRDPLGGLLESARFVTDGAGRCGPDPDDEGVDPDDDDEDPGPRLKAIKHLRFFGTDHLGSTTLVTGGHGRRVARLSYGPWGEPLGAGHDRVRFGYTGHARERRTGNWYSVHRFLDPRAGRWTQRDPIGDVDGQNRYSYVRNSPLGAVDSTGLALELSSGWGAVSTDLKSVLVVLEEQSGLALTFDPKGRVTAGATRGPALDLSAREAVLDILNSPEIVRLEVQKRSATKIGSFRTGVEGYQPGHQVIDIADVLRFPSFGPNERRFDALFHEMHEARLGVQAAQRGLKDPYDSCHAGASEEINRIRAGAGLAPIIDLPKSPQGEWRSGIGTVEQLIRWDGSGNIVSIEYGTLR